MFLQSNRETVGSGVMLWTKSRKWPLVLIRPPPPDQFSGFKLAETCPLDLKWTSHESGMLSSRLSSGVVGIHPVFLIFERQNSCTFCLAIESSRTSGSVETRIVNNVPQHLPKPDRLMRILENSRRPQVQEDGVQEAGDRRVFVTTSAEKRPFGTLIHLRVEKLL
jgi:hypothetical protein